MLEDEGYVSKTKKTDGGWDVPLVGFVHGTRTPNKFGKYVKKKYKYVKKKIGGKK